MSDWPYWFEVAVICALSVLISATAGRGWFFVFLGTLSAGVVVIHAWWLPKKGIDGWTAEPREKYYALRGWKWPPAR